MKKAVTFSCISFPVSIIAGVVLFYPVHWLVMYVMEVTGNHGTLPDVYMGFFLSFVMVAIGSIVTFFLSLWICYRRLSNRAMTKVIEYNFPAFLLGGIISAICAQLFLLLFWQVIAASTFAQLFGTISVWLVSSVLMGIIGFDTTFITFIIFRTYAF